MHPSRSAEIAAPVADPSPVLQLIVVSAVEILQGAAGVIALVEEENLVPRASYGLPAGALGNLHPRPAPSLLPSAPPEAAGWGGGGGGGCFFAPGFWGSGRAGITSWRCRCSNTTSSW